VFHKSLAALFIAPYYTSFRGKHHALAKWAINLQLIVSQQYMSLY
jgi:hypothetical protein